MMTMDSVAIEGIGGFTVKRRAGKSSRQTVRADLRVISPVRGAPKNRHGHGMPQKILIDELAAAGFQVATIPSEWPGRGYCVVFRKPLEKH
jgi:hypothetical protein